jgi:hypothetical protein
MRRVVIDLEVGIVDTLSTVTILVRGEYGSEERDYRLYNISRRVDCTIDEEARPGIYLGCKRCGCAFRRL